MEFTDAEIGFIGQAVEQLVDKLHSEVPRDLRQWRDGKERDRVLTYLYIGKQLQAKLIQYWRDKHTHG